MFDKIKKNEGIKGLIAFIFTVYTIWLSVNVFTLTPMADDWRTAAAPYHNDGTWYRLLPCAIGSPFLRPFEGALGYFLGEHPALFPALNQSIVIIGHLLLICFLYYAIAKYTKHKSAALAGSAVFALSPAAVSTTSQMDGINQCWALVCGVITAYLFVRGTQTKRKFYFIGYFVMAMIATLFKENGISWFLVLVFLCILNDRIKQKKYLLDCSELLWQSVPWRSWLYSLFCHTICGTRQYNIRWQWSVCCTSVIARYHNKQCNHIGIIFYDN